jgi:hypothetical protein
MVAPPNYNAQAFIDLRDRTEYEASFLEIVYEVADVRLIPGSGDAWVYPPGGGAPLCTVYASVNTRVGDWRPGFLDAGAPLVLVTAFKALDMLLEWVLESNGHARTFRFVQKIAALKSGVVFPPLIQARPWLQDRLIALYEQLEPLRGTIIHDRAFKSQKGTLHVSSTKSGTSGPVVTIDGQALRNFSLLMVALLGAFDGTWNLDAYLEKRLRKALDEISHLHQMPSLGQRQPWFLNARVYVEDRDPIDIDLAKIRADLNNRPGNADPVFDLRVIVVARDGSTATAFLIHSDEIATASRVTKSRADLSPYACALPTDVEVNDVARAMALIPANRTP